MPYILSCGVQEAEYRLPQTVIQEFVYDIFPLSDHEKNRLSPIFTNAQINERQLAVDLPWFRESHDFQERNELYQSKALTYSKQAVHSCLTDTNFLNEEILPADIDHIIFVSSTGVATPTLDAYIINDMEFRDSIKRTPMFGLGCAGGTSGVAKASDWLQGHPEASVLVVCVELCSLTFQPGDHSVSNFVGTALFGDGASAVLMIGDESPLVKHKTSSLAYVNGSSSRIKKDSLDVMGWRVVDTGFEVIFNKSIPRLVKEFWNFHVQDVLRSKNWSKEDLDFLVAHPGGRKILESYKEVLALPDSALEVSASILFKHGNMSAPTVNFVLYELMLNRPSIGTKSLMASLGPGFSSEIISMEWV